MIRGENLTKVFKRGRSVVNALNSVDFSIDRGEFVCITGRSGCGKTTFLNIIGFLDFPTSGDIYFEGKKIMDFKEKYNLFILMNDAQILLILIGVAIFEIVLLKAFFSIVSKFSENPIDLKPQFWKAPSSTENVGASQVGVDGVSPST